MALPLWSELQKSQDDPETIEEAIARVVAEHTADPEAHLASGESLESHKTELVIDHPAGSVLADKWTNSELEFSTNFENLSSFVTIGSVLGLWPGFDAESSGNGYANRAELAIDGDSGSILVDFSKEQLFQFIFAVDTGGSAESYFQMSHAYSSTFKRGMGLEVIGTTASFYASNSAGTSFNTLSFGSFSPLQTYIVRMFYDPTTGLISCYKDGELVGTLEWPDTPPSGELYIRFLSIGAGGLNPVIKVKSLFFKVSQ